MAALTIIKVGGAKKGRKYLVVWENFCTFVGRNGGRDKGACSDFQAPGRDRYLLKEKGFRGD